MGASPDPVRQGEFVQTPQGAWMNGEYRRKRQVLKDSDNFFESLGSVHVGRSVEGHQDVGTSLETEVTLSLPCGDGRQEGLESLQHDVAHKVYSRHVGSLSFEIPNTGGLRHEKQVR